MSAQILWYDEQEVQKGVLTYESAVHEEDLDGADKLTVVTRRNVAKRDRLVWQDNAGYWHEHIVDEISTTHSGGAKRHTLTCSNSISELFRIEAPGTKAKKRVSEHLADICAGTRWNAGNSSGTVVEVETWHKSVRECMTELCSQCGGERGCECHAGDISECEILRDCGGGCNRKHERCVRRRQDRRGGDGRGCREAGDHEQGTAFCGVGRRHRAFRLPGRHLPARRISVLLCYTRRHLIALLQILRELPPPSPLQSFKL